MGKRKIKFTDGYSLSTIDGMKRRIFIESDVLDEEDLRSSQRAASYFMEESGEKFREEVFDEVITSAWHHLDETWQSVKNADEIWANTSLMPLIGNSYMGAPVIFNGMMERAIKENVSGKSVFITRSLSSIDWYMIKVDLMSKVFDKNKLFAYDENTKMTEISMKQIRKIAKDNK